ncbi:MAG: right-handed parallel beta-helix repeat-containing protein [Planctomycetes bacterium]|nr:right-handed parallel beta-helix repeat-containing protein [Planctomycetota bacterium]
MILLALMKSLFVAMACVVLFFALPLYAHGAVIYVDVVNGLESNTGSSPDSPLSSIQDGINKADDFDALWVASGDYDETIVMKNSVNLYGGYKNDSGSWTRNVALFQTVIQSAGQTVLFNPNINCTIDGFVIHGGTSGIAAYNAAPIINNCTVKSAQDYGIYVNYTDFDDGSAIISNNNVIENGNNGADDAGICFIHTEKWDWDGVARDSTIIIEGNTISQNNGNGIYILSKYYDANTGSTTVNSFIRNNEIAGNSSKGIFLDVYGFSKNRYAELSVQLDNNSILNHANDAGIYAYSNYSSPKSLLNLTGMENIISDNLAGILNESSFENFTVSGSDLTGNSTYAIQNTISDKSINAKDCWWGSADGPGALKNTVSAMVDYAPQLASSIQHPAYLDFDMQNEVISAGEPVLMTARLKNALLRPLPFDSHITISLRTDSVKGMFGKTHYGPWQINETSMEIPVVKSNIEFFYRNTLPGAHIVDISTEDSNGTGVDASRIVTTQAGPAKRFSFTAMSLSASAGETAGPFVIQAYDDYDNPSSPAQSLQMLMNTDSSSGVFSTSPETFSWDAEYIQFDKSASSMAFYYKDTSSGIHEIGFTNTAYGINETMPILILPCNPEKISFISPPQNAGEELISLPLIIAVTDKFSNPPYLPANALITLSTSSASGMFCDKQGNALESNEAPISSTATAEFFYKDPEPGIHRLTAAYKPVGQAFSASQDITIYPRKISKIVLETSDNEITAGEVSEKIFVRLLHKNGNAIAAETKVKLPLLSTSGTGLFVDSNGLTADSIIIPQGEASAYFRYTDTKSGACQVSTTADTGQLPASSLYIYAQAAKPVKFLFDDVFYEARAGEPTRLISLNSYDKYGNPAVPVENINIVITSSSETGLFSLSKENEWSHALSIPFDGSASFYYKDPHSGEYTITASELTGAKWENAQATAYINASASVSPGPMNPYSTTESAFAQDIVMIQFQINNNGNEDMFLDSTVISSYGTGNEPINVSSVKLAQDTDADGILSETDIMLGNPQIFSEDDGQIMFNELHWELPRQTVTQILVVYSLTGTAKENSTFSCNMAKREDILIITDTDNPVDIGEDNFPVKGNTKTISGIGTLSAYKSYYEPDAEDGYAGLLNLSLSASSAEPIQLELLRIRIVPENSVPQDFLLSIGDKLFYSIGIDAGSLNFLLNKRIEYGKPLTMRLSFKPGGTATDYLLQAGITAEMGIEAFGINSGKQVEIKGLPVWGQQIRIPRDNADVQDTKPEQGKGCFIKILFHKRKNG